MDGQTLQQKVYGGFDKAAQRVGLSYAIHRASGANNPVSGASLGSIYAAFTAGPNYQNPNKYGNPAWYGTLDGSQVNVGDYLVGESTYFIAAKQHLLPVYAVQCNRTISVKRPKQMTGVGAGGYGGNSLADETVMLSGWPASVLQGTKGEKNETGLPGDVRSPWWLILLPAYSGITLSSSDIITDDLNRRYVISSAELTDMGWRITAMQAQA